MKTKIIPIIGIFALLLPIFNSCEDTTYKEYLGNVPVYLSYDDFRVPVSTEQNASLKNPGKIYFKDNYIFITEALKGIHVYDNSNPASPVYKVFIKLPGVVDISITGTTMYADSFVDLVVLDLQDMNNIHEVTRVKDILPYILPPVNNKYPTAYVDREKGVVTGWELKTIKERVNRTYYPVYPVWTDFSEYYSLNNAGGASTGISGSGVGAGGSMARFGIKGNVLYLVNSNSLEVFDITNKTAPSKYNDLYLGEAIETMFLTDKAMFLGTTTGMIVYDISSPLSPQYLSFFTHARSCDPVIVDDTLAYITLRTETTCGSAQNILSVVNIKNLATPVQVRTYPMSHPYGLGKDGDLLFICDGDWGLKIYDASDPLTISDHNLYTYAGINTFDVIPIGKILVLIGKNGLYQYDYSDISKISLLSSILVSSGSK